MRRNPRSNQGPALDEKRLFALGMVETGNNDWEVGAAGEISRYQINPSIWKAYSPKTDYRDPVAATRVARQALRRGLGRDILFWRKWLRWLISTCT